MTPRDLLAFGIGISWTLFMAWGAMRLIEMMRWYHLVGASAGAR